MRVHIGSLEFWLDERPLERSVVGKRINGKWRVLVSDGRFTFDGDGRSLADAIEDALDKVDTATSAARFAEVSP